MKLISSKEEVYITNSCRLISAGIYQRILLVDKSIVWVSSKGNIPVRNEGYSKLEKEYHETLKEMDNEEVKMYLKNK